MKFCEIEIDKEKWDRNQYFEKYLNQKCTFSVTANIDITFFFF